MTENVYKVIELVGTSSESWEKATAAAITRAGKTLRDLESRKSSSSMYSSRTAKWKPIDRASACHSSTRTKTDRGSSLIGA
jgi:flavin-binding protein dodecin